MKPFASLLLLLPMALHAGDDTPVLNFDARPALQRPPVFDQDDSAKLDSSDFRILDYQLMSSEQGERWAVVTLENTASGQRLLSETFIQAEFADGQRRFPLLLTGKVTGGGVITRTVSFGFSRFPVLRLLPARQ